MVFYHEARTKLNKKENQKGDIQATITYAPTSKKNDKNAMYRINYYDPEQQKQVNREIRRSFIREPDSKPGWDPDVYYRFLPVGTKVILQTHEGSFLRRQHITAAGVKTSDFECKTKIIRNKKRLILVNRRSKKQYPIVVGKRGGLSIKYPSSKSRKYIKTICKRANISDGFRKQINALKTLKKL